MSTISSVGGTTASYAAILAQAQKQGQTATSDTTTAAAAYGATNVTLSDAAKAAQEPKDLATVAGEARAALDGLLTAAARTSPLADGKLAVDLASLDRRQLFAISTNAGQQFTVDEQKATAIELQNRFDAALAGPTAVGRVTGDIKGLYLAALSYLDGAGPEEKASAAYADQRAAIDDVLSQLKSNPDKLPDKVPGDPVDAYMDRLASNETGGLRDIGLVATDARATLDAQYEAGGTKPNYADFDSRALAAIALNSAETFSLDEARLAKAEINKRAGAAILAGLKAADRSGDPTAFAQNILSLYGGMSAEERAAAGWSEAFYDAAASAYQTTAKLAGMLSSATGGASAGNSMSLLNFL